MFRRVVVPLFFVSLACIPFPAFCGVSLSPAQTNLSYDGIVQMTASVTKGAAATIDIFFDSNKNGSIDSGEPTWRHYEVTDSALVPPTGAWLVTDTDGSANGSIKVPIMNFAHDDRIAGRFVVRVKSGSSTSQATFINDPPSASQSVSGQLLLNGSGKPGAAFLLDADGQQIYPILTDAVGKYTLPVPEPGSYQVGGMIMSEAGRLNSGVAVTIASGQKKTGVNVSFSSAPYRLKGKVVRTDTGAGVPYVFLDADNESAGGWIAGVADSSGNFDIGVSNGTWTVHANAAAQLGFVGGVFSNGTNRVTVSGATLTGKNFSLTPIGGFVTGRARNGSTKAWLQGASLVATAPGSYDWVASVLSDQDGYWALAVPAGQWEIHPELSTETDLYKTMLYPSARQTKTISSTQIVQSVGTIDFLPCDGSVSVKVVDEQNHAQPGLYLFGCDQGISNSYQSNAGATDGNGVASVPIRRNGTWFVGVNMSDQRLAPPQHRLDVLAQDANVIKLYPLSYRKRPYRVYGGNAFPSNLNYPQDSGYKLLGKAAGTATFAGSCMFYCVVAYDGEVLIDGARGSNGSFYGASSSSMTLQPELIAWPDGKYATVGDNSGVPAVGSVFIQPTRAISALTVVHPDERYNAAQAWWRY
ncbi:hypothetical protein LLG95_04565 [bacterium]|nr:hypothetical protein [bacterium]